jgi:hypothetical protein
MRSHTIVAVPARLKHCLIQDKPLWLIFQHLKRSSAGDMLPENIATYRTRTKWCLLAVAGQFR